MRNLFLIPTDKLSRLFKVSGELKLTRNFDFYDGSEYQHIYITNSEEIKDECWIMPIDGIPYKLVDLDCILESDRKIILTTDQDLINDGVQAIDDEFLEWFVENPSCEEVEIKPFCKKLTCKNKECNVCCQELNYKIIIPQEEPKQETIEEAAKSNYDNKTSRIPIPTSQWVNSEFLQIQNFIQGAKWQQEQDKFKYSEKEVLNILVEHTFELFKGQPCTLANFFEQFKK